MVFAAGCADDGRWTTDDGRRTMDDGSAQIEPPFWGLVVILSSPANAIGHVWNRGFSRSGVAGQHRLKPRFQKSNLTIGIRKTIERSEESGGSDSVRRLILRCAQNDMTTFRLSLGGI